MENFTPTLVFLRFYSDYDRVFPAAFAEDHGSRDVDDLTVDELDKLLMNSQGEAHTAGLFDLDGLYWSVVRTTAEGRVLSVDVRLKRADQGTISASDTMRRIPLVRMVRDMHTASVEIISTTGLPGYAAEYKAASAEIKQAMEAQLNRRLQALDALPRKPGKRGRKGYDATHYELVADVVRNRKAGVSPSAAVMGHFNKPASTAHRWIARCREMGMLDAVSTPATVAATKESLDTEEGS